MIKLKNILTIAVFVLIIGGLMLANIIAPDIEISRSERRKLAVMPEITLKAVMSSEFSDDFEKYALDQFVLRDSFRTVKATTQFYLLWQLENNGIYIADGTVSKIESTLNEAQILTACDKINSVRDEYFNGKTVYFALVPDKNYYIAEKNGYPSLDFDAMKAILADKLSGFSFIELTDCLTSADYYVTDTHWKQASLGRVRDRIAEVLSLTLPSLESYDSHTLSPFYGVYYGQSALPLPPDDITYLTNPATEASSVFNLEINGDQPVYNLEKFTGLDSYDVFMSGAAAFQVATNPMCESGRSLIIFRDSFGGSLVPLLLDAYQTVTLVDLRYISSSLLGDYMEVDDNTDILFMYSPLIINNGSMLR